MSYNSVNSIHQHARTHVTAHYQSSKHVFRATKHNSTYVHAAAAASPVAGHVLLLRTSLSACRDLKRTRNEQSYLCRCSSRHDFFSNVVEPSFFNNRSLYESRTSLIY